MTAYTKTITVGLNLVGMGNAVYWGFTWGSANWGEQSVEFLVYKNLVSTMTVSSTNAFDVSHQFFSTAPVTTTQGFQVIHQFSTDLSLDSSQSRDFSISYGNNLSLGSGPSEIKLFNGPYAKIWPGNTTNFLSAATFAYVSSSLTTTWSIASAASTTWS